MEFEKNIIETLEEEFLPYSSEILINNLPKIDGCLPVHTKVLWALYQNGVSHKKPFIKLLRASSMAMVYYVFGDMPLTKAMTNMANNGMNYLYLDPKGSFGDKQKKDGVAASPRYIECRLSKYGEEMLSGVDKNNVSKKMNFDNTEEEIITLPSMIPNILTNTSQSIAVGEASKIPAHNLEDTASALISYINTRDIDKSIDIIKCPDLSLGGQVIFDKQIFNKIYKTGKGTFTLLGKYRYNEKQNKIEIYEVPYETHIEDIESKLRLSYDKGLFKEIVDIHDSSGRQGIQLDIYLKKNVNIDSFIAKLRKYTSYESKFSCNFTIIDLDNKTPKLMSLEDIFQRWVQHRINCISKELEYDIKKNKKELHRMYGVKLISNTTDDLDKAISIIRQSKTESIAIEKLINEFKLSKEQADYIATIRLVNMNREWLKRRIDNISDLEVETNELQIKLKDKEQLNKIVVEQLEYIKKTYSRPRKTTIIYNDNVEKIDTQEIIEDYTTTLVLTEQNYFKKTIKYSEIQKTKDGDNVKQIIQGSNKDDILLFSNKGNCYKLKSYDLDDCTPSTLGKYLPTMLNLEKDESIIHIASTSDYKGNLIVAFKNGKVASISFKAVKTKTNRSKIMGIINQESPVVNIFDTNNGETNICLISSIDKCVVFNSSIIQPKTSKNVAGNMILKSKNNSHLAKAELVSDIDLEDVEYYRITSGNKTGKYLK